MGNIANWLPSVISVLVVALGAFWASAKHAAKSDRLAEDLLAQSKRLQRADERLAELVTTVAVNTAAISDLEDATKGLPGQVAVNSSVFKDILRRLEAIEKKLDGLAKRD